MSMQFLWDFWQYDFLKNAFVATTLLSIACGLISPLVIAKRYAFLGSAVSHSTLLSLVLSAFVLSIDSPWSFPLTVIITLILSFVLGWMSFKKRLPPDTSIGLFYTSTMGLGMILHTLLKNQSTDMSALLFGNILLINNYDLIYCTFLAIICAVVILGLFWKWQLLASDPEGAELSGLNVAFYHFFFLFLLTTLIVAAVKIAGSIAVNSWIIAPGVFALSVAKDLKTTYLSSVLYALLSSWPGLILANSFNLPSGACICVCQFAFLLLAKLARTRQI